MPTAAIRTYLERLPERQAELKLMLADVGMLPHIEASDRKKIVGAWERVAYDGDIPVRKANKANLMMMGIKV